ncbi:hypothetical protein HYFRA_00010479 [Hymenoscyphus fraxineus]|uniref:Uncharacterized protein n=1 Tax=Hymenoscyphus fraxineus TaxID=746836 RepID=A0A9N9L5Z8_9HELO|nr:hypothetical protein HYFRA_00010479 [Hymenoscyphus fraxineus]
MSLAKHTLVSGREALASRGSDDPQPNPPDGIADKADSQQVQVLTDNRTTSALSAGGGLRLTSTQNLAAFGVIGQLPLNHSANNPQWPWSQQARYCGSYSEEDSLPQYIPCCRDHLNPEFSD